MTEHCCAARLRPLALATELHILLLQSSSFEGISGRTTNEVKPSSTRNQRGDRNFMASIPLAIDAYQVAIRPGAGGG